MFSSLFFFQITDNIFDYDIIRSGAKLNPSVTQFLENTYAAGNRAHLYLLFNFYSQHAKRKYIHFTGLNDAHQWFLPPVL